MRRAKTKINDICRGCIAIIAEKPRSAYKIALFLSNNNYDKITIDNIPVWKFTHKGKIYVVIPSAGHLFSISTNHRGFPVYSYYWTPRYFVERGKSYLRKYYRVFSLILPKASMYINACDYDIEGSVIGFMIIKTWGNIARMKRMKFSALTRDEIIKGFYNLEPADHNMINAGLARHELDWLWGINISRALTYVTRSNFKISGNALSAGRVQTPTLFKVIESYIKRESFIPRPFFNVDIYIKYRGTEYRLNSLDRVFDLRFDAERYLDCVRKEPIAIVSHYKSESLYIEPPTPPNLSDVQHDMYRLYNISPSSTLKILEDLYLDSLISYPRTNSQRYPESIGYISILKSFRDRGFLSSYIDQVLSKKPVKPNNGKNEDPAHPAIYPTGEIAKRFPSKLHKIIYEYIVRRFIATFMDPAKIVRSSAIFNVCNRRYGIQGVKIEYRSWLNVFNYYTINEAYIPSFNIGSKIPISKSGIRKIYEKPPHLYNKSTLLKWMEKMNIGTESTRAEIIDILFKRGYVTGRKNIVPTKLGFLVYYIIKDKFEEISKVELTRDFEAILNNIRNGISNKDEVIKKAINTLNKVLAKIDNSNSSSSVLSTCKICDLPASDPNNNLCFCHLEAYNNIHSVFKYWKINGYSWNEYLSFLSRSKYVGKFVKDLIEKGQKYILALEQ